MKKISSAICQFSPGNTNTSVNPAFRIAYLLHGNSSHDAGPGCSWLPLTCDSTSNLYGLANEDGDLAIDVLAAWICTPQSYEMNSRQRFV